MEQAVLDYYAKLWRARRSNGSDPESYWGYVVSMGCTEANLYALWNARDYLAGRFLLDDPADDEEAKEASRAGVPTAVARRPILKNPVKRSVTDREERKPWKRPAAYTPVLFYSEDTHYSIIKSVMVLGLQTFYDIGIQEFPDQCQLSDRDWPKEVPSNANGSMNIEALATLVEFFAEEGYPILVSFNFGTRRTKLIFPLGHINTATFKGAYDDVKPAEDRLLPIFKNYGLYERKVYYDPNDFKRHDLRNGFWFHVDGALGAAYMPFIEKAYNKGRFPNPVPKFDLGWNLSTSISMSGHKWIGAPWPC